ncbi:ATPase AAA [Rhizocola hellebori]|uniref:ATPase AAA n=1 Tax=Rhizocola hellebori TaxID=1392758 RepID=A0A8J3QL35_9ACTN|nr:ATP-binding protein [Rhizocola hellebori]GIH11794.1 ATPase AAA [Rhizocola hellebori]
MAFVNRVGEIAALDEWWQRPGSQLGIVWGRRRVGKSYLISHWARGKRSIFHVARNRPLGQELAALSAAAAPVLAAGRRDLLSRPFVSWDDVFDTLADAAHRQPLLLTIDEVPELLTSDPSMASGLRAIWERMADTKLRLLLCGSAVRTMEELQHERAPLFGRATLRLRLQPFAPRESALLLPRLSPSERAKAWGVCGGMPFYLSLWDDGLSFRQNLVRLFCSEQALLLNEGELVLSTEDFPGGGRERLPGRLLRAISGGNTRFAELKTAVGADPTRALQATQELDLVERIQPVRVEADGRRALYRIADNFLAFWLTIVEPHRAAITQGLASHVAKIMESQFDDYMGDRWEEALRTHLTRTVDELDLPEPATEVGRFWKSRLRPQEDPCEMDAVVLVGRGRRAAIAGEAKWAKTEDGRRAVRALDRKLHDSGLPLVDNPKFVVCARESVTHADPETLVVTADDIFG